MKEPQKTDSLDPRLVPVEAREPVAHPHYPQRPLWAQARRVVTVVDEASEGALGEEESD